MFLVCFLAWRDRRGVVRQLAGIGTAGLAVAVCFAVSSMGLVVALQLTSVSKVLMILSAAPLFAAVLGWVVLGERVAPVTWAAIAAAMAGIALMVSDSWSTGSIAGDLIALGIAASSATAIVLIRRNAQVAMTPAMLAAVIIATAVSLPLASPFEVSQRDVPLLLLFGSCQLGLGLALLAYGARLIPAAKAALLGTLEPILGPLWVWLALGEAPSPLALAGGGLVLASLVVNTVLTARLRGP